MADEAANPRGPFSDESRADLYFLNARRVLEKEGLDPLVGVEVFAGGDGVLCGIDEVLEHLRGILEDDAEIWALDEGCRISRKEVVLTIRCPFRAIGTCETMLLGTLSQTSGWATAA